MKKRKNILLALGIVLTMSMAVPSAAAVNRESGKQSVASQEVTQDVTQDVQEVLEQDLLTDVSEQAVKPQWKQVSVNDDTKWMLQLNQETNAADGAYVINGKTYWFDQEGYLVTGTVKVEKTTAGDATTGKAALKAGTYFFQNVCESPEKDDLGSMVKNAWVNDTEDGSAWFYMGTDGTIDTGISGWQQVEQSFWVKADKGVGAIQEEGWYQINGAWYYLQADGFRDETKVGIQEVNGKTYCLNKDGIAQKGFQIWDGIGYICDVQKGTVVKANNSWQLVAGDYYWYEDGKPATGWRVVNGKHFYMNPENGKMMTGFYKDETGKLYYSDIYGARLEQAGWNLINNTWYWINTDASVATGWVSPNGKTKYYMGEDGAMAVGWCVIDGTYYFFTGSGAMHTGWLQRFSGWYYLNEDGTMATGWKVVNGKWYYFDENGMMQTGWTQVNSVWYYMDASGAMQTGWLKVPSGWYYLSSNGAMMTGWYVVNGKWYYSNAAGTMMTGWVECPSGWYYTDASGAMQTGWARIRGKWYYLDAAKGGAATVGWKRIGNFKYYFNEYCAMEQDLDNILGRQSSYQITVNRVKCQVMVYAKSETGKFDIPVKTFTCSVGKAGTPTHAGQYATLKKDNPVRLMGPSYGKYGTQINIYGDWFHSVACSNSDPTFALAAGNYNMLGQPASHGCVRLCVRDAKWIYDNCGLYTTVLISDTEATPFDRPATIKIPAGQNWDPTDQEALDKLAGKTSK